MEKVLLVASASSRYTKEYIENVLIGRGFEIDIANIDERTRQIQEDIQSFYSKNNIGIIDYEVTIRKKHRKTHLLFSRIRNILKLRIIKQYDYVHFHYITEDAISLLFYKPRKKSIVTLYGSDFLRASKPKILMLKKVVRRCNVVTVATLYMQRKASEVLGLETNRIRIIPFGVNNIEYAKVVNAQEDISTYRIEYGLPQDKLIVFAGYNGNPAHRHINILNKLETLPINYRERLCVVFFCSYGLSEEYRSEINQAISHSSIECRLVTTYLVGEQMMRFRKCGDIMLNLQSTDVLSASMLESLAVGNIVIKGDWLQYNELEEINAFMLSIDNINSLSNVIKEVIDNIHSYKCMVASNREKIYGFLSWNSRRETWRMLF